MAFTWKPQERRRAHTLSTSLWPVMKIAAIQLPGQSKWNTSRKTGWGHPATTADISQTWIPTRPRLRLHSHHITDTVLTAGRDVRRLCSGGLGVSRNWHSKTPSVWRGVVSFTVLRRCKIAGTRDWQPQCDVAWKVESGSTSRTSLRRRESSLGASTAVVAEPQGVSLKANGKCSVFVAAWGLVCSAAPLPCTTSLCVCVLPCTLSKIFSSDFKIRWEYLSLQLQEVQAFTLLLHQIMGQRWLKWTALTPTKSFAFSHFTAGIGILSKLLEPCHSHWWRNINSCLSKRTLCIWDIGLSLNFFSSSERLVRVHLTFDIEGMPSCCSLWDCDSACPNLNWWRCGSSAKSSLYLSARTIYVH